MILAAGAVHSHLVHQNLRTFTSLNVRSAECLDVHGFAVLIGVGATTVNAYLAEESVLDRFRRSLFPGLDPTQCMARYKKAISDGLLKIMSKMGTSVLSSYRGGYNFEAVGLSRTLVADFFPGMPSRISGIGLNGILHKLMRLHREAWAEETRALPVGGLYRYRRGGERHAWEGDLIHTLQTAVATDSYTLFKNYTEGVRDRPPVDLRDLLDFTPRTAAVLIDEVEIDHRDPQAVRHAGHVARRAEPRGARDPDHRHEPHRRAVQLGRGRRGC